MWRSEKHKKWVVEGGRFSATVIASALLAIWLPHAWRGFTTTVKRATRSTEGDENRLPSATRRPVPVGKIEDLYRKHLEEIFRSLDAHGSVTMVKVRLPVNLLRYQQNPATSEGGRALRLEGEANTIPFVAVSVTARKFLDQMLVTYVDPQKLPPQFIPDKLLPFKSSLLSQFILVPDLSGDNAAYFSFDTSE